MTIDDRYRAKFEELGLEKVVVYLKINRFGPDKKNQAEAWVAEQQLALAREASERDVASNLESRKIARSAKNAAWAAAIAAIIAAVFAVMSYFQR